MADAVILLSGGLDSYTTAAIARSEGFRLFALTLRYGQRHARERHLELDVDLSVFGGSSLTTDAPVPKDRPLETDGIPSTYVPARNTVFLALALAWAEALGSSDIFIGVNALDYSGYPDCRPEFIQAFERLASLATAQGVGGTRVRIHAPLQHLSKAEIIRKGLALGLDYGLTHSCYDPAPGGRPCGRCDSCALRAAGFAAAGIADPVLLR
jgi:7-cyano-7-deazaguanine synthase